MDKPEWYRRDQAERATRQETQTTPKQCSANVYRSDGVFGGTPCMNKGKTEERGKWWCSVHTRSAQRRREEKSKARWDKESARLRDKDERTAETLRRAEHYDALVEALGKIAGAEFTPQAGQNAFNLDGLLSTVQEITRAALDAAREA